MKIGLIGHDGFIGKHLKNRLNNLDNIELKLFNRNEHSLFDLKTLEDFVKNIDIIIHAAGVNRGSSKEIIKGNLLITENLITAIHNYNPGAKLFYISSMQAKEKYDSIYGISKRFTEMMLECYYLKYKISSVVFRLANVFGPGCKPFYNSVIATFCYQIVKNKKIEINTKNDQYSFVYIDDVVNKIIENINKKDIGFDCVQVLADNKITIPELAEIIKSFSEAKQKSEIINKFKISSIFYDQLLITYNSYK